MNLRYNLNPSAEAFSPIQWVFYSPNVAVIYTEDCPSGYLNLVNSRNWKFLEHFGGQA